MTQRDNKLEIVRLMKNLIKTREKQINHIIESSAFSTKHNHLISKYYDDITNANIYILKYRNEVIKSKMMK